MSKFSTTAWNHRHQQVEIPESFTDEEILDALRAHEKCVLSLPSVQNPIDVSPTPNPLFPLNFGLMVKVRSSIRRVEKRAKYIPPQDESALMNSFENRYYLLVLHWTADKMKLLQHWTPVQLWAIATELVIKSINLNVKLYKDFLYHPLHFQTDSSLVQKGLLIVSKEFLERVKAYHSVVQRPQGTFEYEANERGKALADLPRAACARCKVNRQIYCGPCGGIRLANAEHILPNRIDLPFDILLLLHWRESLVKCTGIGYNALSSLTTITYLLLSSLA